MNHPEYWFEFVLNNAAAWVATYLLYSTILLGGVALAARRDRLDPETENSLWRIALWLGPVATTTRVAAEHVGTTLPTGLDGVAVAGPLGTALIATVTAAVALAGCRTGTLPASFSRERACIADRRDLVAGPDHRMLEDLVRRAAVRTPRLSVSASLEGPIALVGGEICLPAHGFASLPADVRRAILAHELGHVVRRDPTWSALCHAAGRLLFFQPLLRIAARRMRETAEFLADDFATRLTGRPEPLVEGLAALARRQNGVRLGAVGFRPGSLLVRRVDRVIGARPPGRRLPRFGIRALGAAAFLVVWWTPAIVPDYDCRLTGVAAPAVSLFPHDS